MIGIIIQFYLVFLTYANVCKIVRTSIDLIRIMPRNPHSHNNPDDGRNNAITERNPASCQWKPMGSKYGIIIYCSGNHFKEKGSKTLCTVQSGVVIFL